MCNSHIQSFCHPFTDLTAVQKCKNKFRRRTCVRQYVVQIGKGAVADMMINAQGFSRTFKQRGREAQTFRISAVKADKKIVFLSSGIWLFTSSVHAIMRYASGTSSR